mgnify:CR=1 FL=1
MSFVSCQIDLAVKIILTLFHKDAHSFTDTPPIEAGLDDLLTIYSQGHNQSGRPFECVMPPCGRLE